MTTREAQVLGALAAAERQMRAEVGGPLRTKTAISTCAKVLKGLPEDDVLLGAMERPPGAEAALDRAPDPFAEIRVAADDLREDGDRPQTGRGLQHRHDPGLEKVA